MRWMVRLLLLFVMALGIFFLQASLFMRGASAVSVATAKWIRAQVNLKDIKMSLGHFYVEYIRWPLDTSADSTRDIEEPLVGPLLEALLGKNVRGNLREIVFLDPPPSTPGRWGLQRGPGPMRYLDEWGNPVRVILDTNGDGKIANPDLTNQDLALREGAPSFLEGKVLVFSCGPDGVAGTGDDVTSWRKPPKVEPSTAERIMRSAWVPALVASAMIVLSWLGLRSLDKVKVVCKSRTDGL